MSFLRIAASAAIFTLLSAVCATAKPITTTGETNLRKSPGTDSPVLTIIPKGTTVEVGKCSNGWCETSTDGRTAMSSPEISAWHRHRDRGPLRRSMTRKSRRLGRRSMVRESMPVPQPIMATGRIMATDRITGIMADGDTGVGDGAGRVRDRFQRLGSPPACIS